MTPAVEILINAGDKLEIALGHSSPGCPQINIPCTCGSNEALRKAMKDWDWMMECFERRTKRTKFLYPEKPPEATVEYVIGLGNAIARAAGHSIGCTRLSPAAPCLCGKARGQGAALEEWDHLVAVILAA